MSILSKLLDNKVVGVALNTTPVGRTVYAVKGGLKKVKEVRSQVKATAKHIKSVAKTK